MYVKPRQTHNELVLCPPVDQIRRTSIGRWSLKLVKFVCELAFFPSGDQNNVKCANKQKKKRKKKYKREKLVVLMTGYSRLVTKSVSFRQSLTWLTHWVSRRFARLLCRPHFLQMRCNKLKDGFYGQNPAYFPQIYLWIHDKCSSTSYRPDYQIF